MLLTCDLSSLEVLFVKHSFSLMTFELYSSIRMKGTFTAEVPKDLGSSSVCALPCCDGLFVQQSREVMRNEYPYGSTME